MVRELSDTNVLRDTPEPRGKGDHIECPAWPQGDYLRRVLAKHHELASTTANIPERAGGSKNPRVHQEIAGIAVHLPKESRSVPADRETAWIAKNLFT